MFHGRKNRSTVYSWQPQQKSFKYRLMRLTLVPVALLLSAFFFFSNEPSVASKEDPNKSNRDHRKVISNALSPSIRSSRLPASADFKMPDETLNLNINYTFDPDLQKEADMLLKRYKPDYGAIFMIEAKTGKILAMASIEKANPNGTNLNLKATFPAASVFKIITAAAAVDHAGIQPEHKIAFNGANYTLYKKNVLSEKINRWTRIITLKEAFARSINTAFGRLTLENLEPKDLAEYAKRFMFNSEINSDFQVESSQAQVPEEKGFELTQVAAGYNRFNTLSPVHGAMIAATIINDGKMVSPYMIEELKDSNGESVYKGQVLENSQVVSAESAQKVREMMEQTVLSGTSRKSFRSLIRDKKFKEVEMGGKTGHFSGTNPKGRTDWFVGYASDGDNKVAIAAITVNIKKWTVKSSQLGEMMFRKHFKSILEEKEISSKNDQIEAEQPAPPPRRKIASARKNRRG